MIPWAKDMKVVESRLIVLEKKVDAIMNCLHLIREIVSRGEQTKENNYERELPRES